MRTNSKSNVHTNPLDLSFSFLTTVLNHLMPIKEDSWSLTPPPPTFQVYCNLPFPLPPCCLYLTSVPSLTVVQIQNGPWTTVVQIKRRWDRRLQFLSEFGINRISSIQYMLLCTKLKAILLKIWSQDMSSRCFPVSLKLVFIMVFKLDYTDKG